jgi:putative endonuclease
MKPYYFVYIIEAIRTSKKNFKDKIFYTGFTDNPSRRLNEHRNKKKSNFMRTFKILPKRIVYLEQIKGFYNTLKREKEIKKLSLNKKLDLIKDYGIIE